MVLYKVALLLINFRSALKGRYKTWKFNKYAVVGKNCMIEGGGVIYQIQETKAIY